MKTIRAGLLSVAVLGLSAAFAMAASPVGTPGAHGKTISALAQTDFTDGAAHGAAVSAAAKAFGETVSAAAKLQGAEKSAAAFRDKSLKREYYATLPEGSPAKAVVVYWSPQIKSFNL